MKAVKGVDDLAARLTSANATPLVAPQAAAAPTMSEPVPTPAPAKRERKIASKKEPVDTMQLTIRPTRALNARYVAAAAKRSQLEGRVVTVQEIMLEILEKGGL
ncbi:hypothetical protein [Paraburkholderia caffeinilytica]|uniref:hypothetical protein n=1 Tax=Paraburkholderia caffeinilytica TaxID=1761016 RepID=UPI003D9FF49C